MSKKLPLGLQDFRKIIENGFLYVDKTAYLYKLAVNPGVYFLSRPRRFGKSITIATLHELFSGSRELFEGLWIQDKWDWGRKYPVLHIKSMMNKFSLLLTALLTTGLSTNAIHAQIVYANDTGGNVWSIDMNGCNTSLVVNMPVFNDMAISASGVVYGLFGNSVFVYDPVTGTTTLLATINFGVYTALEIGPGGQLYAVGFDVVSINIVSGAVQFIGALPNGWFADGDVTFLNGIYYMTVVGAGGTELINLNLNNPALSTTIDQLPQTDLIGLAGVGHPQCPKIFMFQIGPPSAVYSYDVVTGQFMFECTLPFAVGGADTPNGYAFNGMICGECVTEAGTFSEPSISACVGETLDLPYNNDAVLDFNDVEGFIVVADTNPPLSVLSYLTAPTLNYNPALFTPGVTYYVANVAGNPLPNGQANPADTCYERSEYLSVVWNPKPTVVFSPPGLLCAGDCILIDAVLTGTPQFTFDWNVTQGQNELTSGTLVTGAFSETVEVCIPANFSPLNGGVQLNITLISDAFCACP
jgi:hypothetical protein